MRLGNYIDKDNNKYKLIMEDSLRIPDANKILQKSWVVLRESLTNEDQTMLVKIINKNFGTNYRNIYFIKEHKNLNKCNINKTLINCCNEIDENIIKSEYYSEDYDLQKYMIRGLMWLSMNLEEKNESNQ